MISKLRRTSDELNNTGQRSLLVGELNIQFSFHFFPVISSVSQFTGCCSVQALKMVQGLPTGVRGLFSGVATVTVFEVNAKVKREKMYLLAIKQYVYCFTLRKLFCHPPPTATKCYNDLEAATVTRSIKSPDHPIPSEPSSGRCNKFIEFSLKMSLPFTVSRQYLKGVGRSKNVTGDNQKLNSKV